MCQRHAYRTCPRHNCICIRDTVVYVPRARLYMCLGHNHRTRLANVTETHFNQTIVHRRALTVVCVLSRALPLRCGFDDSLCSLLRPLPRASVVSWQMRGSYVRRSGLWGNLEEVREDSRCAPPRLCRMVQCILLFAKPLHTARRAMAVAVTFSAFKPISRPQLVGVIPGLPNLLPPMDCREGATQRNQNRTQKKTPHRQDQANPPRPLLLHLLRAGLDPPLGLHLARLNLLLDD